MTDLENFNLATADKYQLKYFAKTLGLNLSMSMNEQTMREKIEAYHIQNDMEMPVSELPVAPSIKAQRSYTINIPKSAAHDGAEPVFVGVQGVGYTIPRGINIKVPESVVEVLKNAIQDIVTQDEDGVIHHDESLLYAYQIIATHEAVAA